jgi:RHS repeat-associated protein
MRRNIIIAKRTLTTIKNNLPTNQFMAMFLLITLLMPITAPIPAWAYTLNLSPNTNNGFELIAPTPTLAASTLGFAGDLMSNFGTTTKVDEANGKLNESPVFNKAVLESKVKKLKTNLSEEETIKIGGVIALKALPLDEKGFAVQGLAFNWETADQDILRITPNGEAVGVSEGETVLTAKAGKFKKDFIVKVSISEPVKSAVKNMFAVTTLVNQLPPSEIESKYSTQNNLGNPPGKTEMDSSQQAAAIGIRHRVGIANFSFGLPLASLPGRGLNAGVSMSYNSRTWNKSAVPIADPPYSQPHFTYDVEESWIAPGFISGFGYLETQARLVSTHPTTNTGVFSYYTDVQPIGITDADGTRRQFTCGSWVQITGTYETRCIKYISGDGTFISTTSSGLNPNPNNSQTVQNNPDFTFVVNYPNGSKVYYGGSYGSGDNLTKKQYPSLIQDSNGNLISINYVTDGKGRIDYIRDTMNRYIRFYYDTTTDKKLIAITVPTFGQATAERQAVRFYYAEMPLDYVGKYTGITTAPATIKVLNHVYFPATNMGYKYDYHANFGMITKIQRFQGMQSSSNSLTETGTIVNDGNWAATTEYNYPVNSTPIDDVPKYTERTDDWYGRDTANLAPKVLYHSPNDNTSTAETKLTSRIETANGTYSSNTINETYSYNTNDFKNGLVSHTIIRDGIGQFGTPMSKTKYYWEPGIFTPGSGNYPILRKIEVTNEASQTKATRFEYDEYNNQTVVEEYDFAAPGSIGTLLRRTETAYQKGAGWINRNLLNLPTSVIIKINNAPVSKTLIEYDNNGASGAANLTLRPDIDQQTHDVAYNPSFPSYTYCIPGCTSTYCCNVIPRYNATTDFRGNVTKVTSFSDATLATDSNASVSTTKYDIAGNAVEAGVNCCRKKTFEYDKANEYAYQISETKGDTEQETTSAAYDRNTGLIFTATDENNQTTQITYDPITLRQTRTDKPNGAWSTTEYNDQSYPFYVKSTSSLDANRSVSSWSFSDGRGVGYRTRSQTTGGYLSSDTAFDKNGSLIKNFNPYTVAGLNDPRPSGIKASEITNRDALGRVAATKLQDDTVVSAIYSGTETTATDQAGKSRRQKTDALGRIVRVDEPDANGNLGDVASPIQPTSYEYDGNDNLSKVTQSDGTNTQIRLFKYDSLSRLTNEKQVEATATLNDVGAKVGASGQWTGVYKYDVQGLLTEGVDARGVKTTFAYDGLNRVASVSYTGESGYATPNVAYTYDEVRGTWKNKGRLTTVQTAVNVGQQTPETKQMYDYNNVGEVVNHTQSIGNQSYNLTYGYNLAGQLTSEKYPSGKVYNYSVDDYGRLQSVADTQRTYLSSVSFTNQGLLGQMNLGNGTSEVFGYNDRFQMTSQNLNKGSQVLQKYDYGYGKIDENTGNLDLTKNNGQLGKIESFIGSQKQATQKFSYDSIGRLSDAKEYKGTDNALTYKEHFDFDRFGNLYRKAANNGTSGQSNPLAYTPIEETDISKATNRFTSATNTTYNEAGMVVGDNKFRSMNFSYDANGRQVKATKANVADARSVYDALGNRVATKVNDIWQFVIYDAFGKLVAEYGTQGEGLGGVSYVLQDWQGSVRASVNNNGFIQARFDFTAFGEEVSLGVGLRSLEQGYTGDATTRQGYGLTEKDYSGQNHTGWRKNENRAGRWTSPDPYKGSMSLGDPQSFNRYSYVGGDAVNFVDPSGLLLIAFFYQICESGPNGDGTICHWAIHFMDTGGSGGNETGGGGGGGNNLGSSIVKDDKDECDIQYEKDIKQNQRDLNGCRREAYNKFKATVARLEKEANQATPSLTVYGKLAAGYTIGIGLGSLPTLLVATSNYIIDGGLSPAYYAAKQVAGTAIAATLLARRDSNCQNKFADNGQTNGRKREKCKRRIGKIYG